MDIVGPGQIEFKVHGLTTEDHGRVPARVFANKLKQLVLALEASDELANGRPVHTYVLASMHMSQPTAILAEVPLAEFLPNANSAIPSFNGAIESIKTQDAKLEHYASVVRKIGLLTSGVEKKFGFAEVATLGADVVRIDGFLWGRTNAARKVAADPWFNGIAFGSFDGTLEYVDTRGSLPQIKLLLSAGGKEIDCVCRREDVDALGDALAKRVRVYGRCIYEGTRPLPVRVEVTSIEKVAAPSDFSVWRGAFKPFDPLPWDASPVDNEQ